MKTSNETDKSKRPENHKILEKSMLLLETVSDRPDGISLTDLCCEVDMPKGSAHMLLKTLVNMGYLRADPRTMLYYIGLKSFEVGARYVENNRPFRYVSDVLEKLVSATGETAHMAVLDGIDVVYINKFQHSQAIHMVSIIGRRIPAHATAIGKALLSDYSNDEVIALYRDRQLTRLTENTITDLDMLIAQLEKTRIVGYAYESCESSHGIECVAVSVGRPGDPSHMAISISAPVDAGRADMQQFITPLLEAKQFLQIML